VKCLIEVYINFTSDFDRGHGPLREMSEDQQSWPMLYAKQKSVTSYKISRFCRPRQNVFYSARFLPANFFIYQSTNFVCCHAATMIFTTRDEYSF